MRLACKPLEMGRGLLLLGVRGWPIVQIPVNEKDQILATQTLHVNQKQITGLKQLFCWPSLALQQRFLPHSSAEGKSGIGISEA